MEEDLAGDKTVKPIFQIRSQSSSMLPSKPDPLSQTSISYLNFQGVVTVRSWLQSGTQSGRSWSRSSSRTPR